MSSLSHPDEHRPISFAGLAEQQARLGPAVSAAVERVWAHGQYIMGPEVGLLEDRLAALAGTRHAVACSNGTDALILALLANGVGRGDAVIVPTFTFAATAEAVARVGATPVFADVAESTYNIDPASAKDCLSVAYANDLRPRALVAVDLFGQPAEYSALRALCDERELLLVSDAAQSFGAKWEDRPAASISDVTTTSFFPSKPLGCHGDGGAVFTSDDSMAKVMRSLRTHGQGSHKYENVHIGLNARLDTIQAAILLVKLDAFPEELEARDAVARRYDQGLPGGVVGPVVDPRAVSTWAQYTVRITDRDRTARTLKSAGIPTAIYYPTPLHEQPAYRDLPRAPAGLAVAEALSRDVLSLPIHAYLGPSDQDHVLSTLAQAHAG